MILTNDLRFIERDGKRILQQKWASVYYPASNNEWRDVPMEKSEPTEREQVCDEILGHIRSIPFCFFDPGSCCLREALRKNVEKIRDRKERGINEKYTCA